MQTALSPAPSAVNALTPHPIYLPAYWLGRVIGRAVASVAGGLDAIRTSEVAPLTK